MKIESKEENAGYTQTIFSSVELKDYHLMLNLYSLTNVLPYFTNNDTMFVIANDESICIKYALDTKNIYLTIYK